MNIEKTFRVIEIEEILKEANKIYSETGEDGIPEDEYNKLMKELEELDPDNGLLSKIEPVQVFSKGKVKYENLMLSLEKVYNIEDLKKWMKKVSRTTNERFVVMPKLDGIAGRFKDGILSTRGDGENGEDISHRIPLIKFFDEEYDGELLINDSMFKDIVENKLLTRKDGTPFKNSRNAVGGILGSEYEIDWQGQEKPIWFMPYDWISTEATIETIEEVIKINKEQIKNLPTDGIVVKLADEEYAKSLGHTSHHYKHSIALKEETITVETILKDVEYQVAKNHIGVVGILDPIEISGVTVSRVSLHNIDFIKSHDLKIGDKVVIKRAGEVIPHLVSSMGGGYKEIKCTSCPSCGSDVKVDNPFWKCINPDCSDSQINKLVSSCKVLGLKGIAKSTVEKLYKVGVKNIADLLEINEDTLIKAGWKPESKSMGNIINEINRVRLTGIEVSKILGSLNIEGFGEHLFKKILSEVSLEELEGYVESKSIESLKKIPNMSEIRSKRLIEGYDLSYVNRLLGLFQWYEDRDVKVSRDILEEDNRETICFTGKMPEKRSVLEEWSKNYGYDPVNKVSKDLDILVVEDLSSNSSKIQKARKFGTKIISREDFYQIIGRQ